MNPLLRCLIALSLIAVGTVSSASAPGALQFSVANFTASESAGTATINVSRINGTNGVVAVSYTASNGTATAGVDFAVTSGFLIWADGDAANKSFTVSLGNDAIVEGDETVNLSLGSASGGATLGTPATATLTILDDDGVSSLVVSNHSFEFPAIAAGTFSTTAAPPGWSPYGSLNFNARTIGVLRPGTTTLYAEPAPLGQNVGVIFLLDNPANQTFFANLEAGMRQTLAATLQTRRQYTLRVEVGNIANDVNAPFQFGGFPNYRIDLLAGTNVLASDNNSRLPGEGRFLTTTVAVATAASHPFAGQPLGIRLVNLNSAPGIEVNWDNVRLESAPSGPPPVSLVSTGALWSYLDDQTEPAPAWRAAGFNDAGWSNGVGQLGFGDGDEATLLRRLMDVTPIITAYFRRAFVAPHPTNFSQLQLRLLRDDGGVVYLNGVEVFRSNMPDGPISYSTFARESVGTGPEESTFYFATNLPPGLLVEGTNTLAVEIHQITQFSSTDLSFDLALDAWPVAFAPPVLFYGITNGILSLAWPSTATGYTLRATTTLLTGADWPPANAAVIETNGQFRATVPVPPSGARFFRLQAP